MFSNLLIMACILEVTSNNTMDFNVENNIKEI